MLAAILTTSLAAIFVWHAWHREIVLMPRMPPWAIAGEILVVWLMCLPSWRDLAQTGLLYPVISTISAAIASGALLALDRRYSRLERRRQQNGCHQSAG